MEEQHPALHFPRMQNKPPLPPEETPGHCQKHKKTQNTKHSTSIGITYIPPSKINSP